MIVISEHVEMVLKRGLMVVVAVMVVGGGWLVGEVGDIVVAVAVGGG